MEKYSHCRTFLKILNNSNKTITGADDFYACSILRALSSKYGRNYMSIINANERNLQKIERATIVDIFDVIYGQYNEFLTQYTDLYYEYFATELSAGQYSAILCRMLARLLARLTDEQMDIKFEF